MFYILHIFCVTIKQTKHMYLDISKENYLISRQMLGVGHKSEFFKDGSYKKSRKVNSNGWFTTLLGMCNRDSLVHSF